MTAVYLPTLNIPSCSPTVPDAITFNLLGGGEFHLPILPSAEEQFTLAIRGLQQLGGQLSPQVPVIALLNAVVAIKNFIVDLPTNIAATIALNTQPMADSISSVVNAVATVAGLTVPGVAFGQQILGTIRLMRLLLQGLQAKVAQLITRQTDINAALAKANELGNASLLATAQCAQTVFAADVTKINRSISTIGAAVAIVNVLICLLTGNHALSLPVVPTIDANALSAAIFDAPLTALTTLENTVSPFVMSGATFAC